MGKRILLAGLAAAALIPSIASAQTDCWRQRSNDKVAGTLLGAGVGALLGSAIAGSGNAGTGAVVGGVGGAVVGNSVAGNTDCRSSGYYDRDGAWHASAAGYYDRAGRWVVSDRSGYYDSNGSWVSGPSSGYFDNKGHWVYMGPPNGYYDRSGIWVAAADRPASTVGYYDGTTGAFVGAPSASNYGEDVAYVGRDRWSGAPLGVHQRMGWIEQRIRRGMADGSLTGSEAGRALRDLRDIRRQEARLRYDGSLSGADRAYLQARLDSLSDSLRWMRRNGDRDVY